MERFELPTLWSQTERFRFHKRVYTEYAGKEQIEHLRTYANIMKTGQPDSHNAPTDPGPRPRYQWRLTWPDEVKDQFTGSDGKRNFGIIHKHHNVGWAWFMNWDFPFERHIDLAGRAGHADTPRLAAKAAEDCYDLCRKGEWPGMTDRDRQWMRDGVIGHQETMAMQND